MISPRIVAVIPARGGSKGLPGKNVKLLHGKPLIAYTIDAALQSNLVDRVICSTDDKEISKIAIESGAEVPFRRPPELATDTANTPPVIEHAISFLENNESYYPEIIVTLQPTSPLRRASQLDEALEKYQQAKFDSLISVKRSFPPWWLFKKENERIVPLIKLKGGRNPLLMERQEFDIVYQPNGAIYITKRSFLKSNNTLINTENCGFYEMDEQSSLDIDTITDFMVIEKIIEGRN